MNDKPEKLPYSILGTDNQSQIEKLSKYTGDVDWDYIKPHYEAGNVIYVDPELDLETVGHAFFNDDLDQVAAWKKKADILTPGAHHAQWWEHDNTSFIVSIVKPFVLIQPAQSTS